MFPPLALAGASIQLKQNMPVDDVNIPRPEADLGLSFADVDSHWFPWPFDLVTDRRLCCQVERRGFIVVFFLQVGGPAVLRDVLCGVPSRLCRPAAAGGARG